MKAHQEQSKLMDALSQLELCLETPVMPGELPEWVETVDKAFAEMKRCFEEALQREHAAKFKQICDEDIELARQVDELQEEDQTNAEKLHAVETHLRVISEHVANFEPDEMRIDDKVKELIEKGLDLVVHIRMQEVALDSWCAESLNRDSGVAD